MSIKQNEIWIIFDKNKQFRRIKRLKKILIRILAGIILFLLTVGILLMLPPVQTFIGKIVTQEIKKSTGADIQVNKVALSIFGGVRLKDVLIRDHHQDTMIYSKSIHTQIFRGKEWLNGNLYFGDVRANELTFFLKMYKGEESSNINVFVEQLEGNSPPSDKPFILKIRSISIINGHFKVINENAQTPVSVDFTKLNAELHHFDIYKDKINTQLKMFSFQDHRGVFIENLTGEAFYSKTRLHLKKSNITTKERTQLIGDIVMTYNPGDLADFTDKVVIDARFDKRSRLASSDIYSFYPEVAQGLLFDFGANALGTLNHFKASDLYLSDGKTTLDGDLTFTDVANTDQGHFSISGSLKELSSTSSSLKALLPRILGNKLPDELDNLGLTHFSGDVSLNTSSLIFKTKITTDIGNLHADIHMQNLSDSANLSYVGKVRSERFHLGKLLNNKALGSTTTQLNITGKGFTQHTVNTTIEGAASTFFFNGYPYKNVLFKTQLHQPDFSGELHIDDDNAKFSFKGLLDLSSKIKKYNIETQIDYADLYALKLIQRDTLSVLKGGARFIGQGNSLDKLSGALEISRASYQNKNDTYFFEDFYINSTFDEKGTKTITINSPDIIEGRLIGNYKYAELPMIVENALGTLYTNYSPHKIAKNQFIQFNFSIYNKIIEVFFPYISLGKNTYIKGNINPEQEIFKLDFSAPTLSVGNNKIDKLNLKVDSKNPLYSAYAEMDSLRMKNYKIANFSMMNIKHNDTLFFRTECKGGERNQDYYNLNMYYTINKEENSVIGFQKSELNFKNYLWHINQNNNDENEIIFHKNINNFIIEDIELSHKDQLIKLAGVVKGDTYKNIDLSFKDVDLAKITPDIENLNLGGILNGEVNFKQQDNIYKPTSSLEIIDFSVNETAMGDFVADIQGDESLRKFGINAYLYSSSETLLSVEGDLEIIDKETIGNFDIQLNDLNLQPFNSFGKGVISNLRGLATGRAHIIGNLRKPEINGRFFLKNTGLKIPYLNVDVDLENNSILDITDRNIFFRDITLTDTKYKTKGLLFGTIEHKLFSDWILDLHLSSNRFLALDTKDSETALYYGTAFIKGGATISGPTSGLLITANATSDKGTSIKIPIGEIKTEGDISFIKFLTPDEKYRREKDKELNFNTMGMELRFNLTVTPDAEIDIIIDRSSGHAIRGGRGNGTLEMDINTLGRFTMNGIFTVEDGHYDFRYGGIISKRFNVKRGGTITWSGNPFLANMNLQGVYSTEANPAVLLDNPSFNRKIPVNLIIDVKGTLEALQEPDFTINFPSVSSVLQSEIQYKLSDADTRRNQAFSLLMFRNFTGSDGMDSGGLAGSLTETASSLFNNLLSNEDSVFQIEVDYTVKSRNPNNNKDFEDFDRLGINLSTQINEDITINGKLGVPVGGTQESVVVGNIEALLRLNQSRTLNARVFNRENDINYFGEGIGYTQGVGITWDVNFDNFEELWQKLIGEKNRPKSKVLQVQKEKSDKTTQPDSDLDFNKDFQKFIENRGRQRHKHIQQEQQTERPPDPF